MNEKRAVDIAGWILLVLVAAFVLLALYGCARGYGPGPRSDGEQQEIERIRKERERGQDRDIRPLNPMGGG